MRFGAWVLVPLQGAAAVWAWELGCWCCRVPVEGAVGNLGAGAAAVCACDETRVKKPRQLEGNDSNVEVARLFP